MSPFPFKKVRAMPFGSVNVTQVYAALGGDPLVLDVRERDEWESAHIAGAVHVPLGTLTSKLDRIPADRPVVAVCRSGMRSAKAASILAAAGRDASNMSGGMLAWMAHGLPVVSGR